MATFSSGVNTNFSTELNNTMVPIGGIIPWVKSQTGTPSLPSNGEWVECNGQTLNDSESPYDGVTIPDLNGNNYFLRGNSSSGGTGGSQNKTHNHQWTISVSGAPYLETWESDGVTRQAVESYTVNSGSDNEVARVEGGDPSHWTENETLDNQPQFYDVVWIIRVK